MAEDQEGSVSLSNMEASWRKKTMMFVIWSMLRSAHNTWERQRTCLFNLEKYRVKKRRQQDRDEHKEKKVQPKK